MQPDPLQQFRQTLQEALFHAEMNTELIRVRHLIRRALNVTEQILKEKGADHDKT